MIQVLRAAPLATVRARPTEAGLKVRAVPGPRVVAPSQGPPGRRGSPGTVLDYVHQQPSEAAEWICNHNLGSRPTTTVYAPSGQEVVADVRHVSPNQTRIYFASPRAGSARFT